MGEAVVLPSATALCVFAVSAALSVLTAVLV